MEERKSLQKAVCEAFEIEECQLWQETRKREIVDARKCYVYIINECMELGASLTSKLTKLDRVKIIYYCHKFTDHYRRNKQYQAKADKVFKAYNNRELSLLINI